MNLNIVCIPSDGIGLEIIAEAKGVLNKTAEKSGHNITYKDVLMGGTYDCRQLCNAAYKKTDQFDVILIENMFGDILSDEASAITGSIGMLSSASLNDTKFGLYEPSSGAAPDVAEKGIANPIATILCAAMMFRYSFDLEEEAGKIEAAVKQVLAEGYRTVDIMPREKNQNRSVKQVGTEDMGKLIAERI